ncbi:MAG: hypothetical protein IKS51_03480 [Erysipelotrichaceae bacterium]|nr:hypothetical protein [Erysipelotrichaceae bacterium]
MSKKLGIVALLLFLLCGAAGGYLLWMIHNGNKTSPYFLASYEQYVTVRTKEGDLLNLPRGTMLEIRDKDVTIDDVVYKEFEYNENLYYTTEDVLRESRKDCVLEEVVYALRDHVLTADYDTYKIAGFVYKGQELTVDSYHELKQDGLVDYYLVDGTGYISSEYASIGYYETAYDSSVYADVYYKDGGDPTLIDYYPKEELSFDGMPEIVKALYINAEAVENVDSYLALARGSSINAFVVDIKDCYVDTQLGYDSPVARSYAPSTSNIPNTFSDYQEAMRKIKDEGYYLIGRITAFKDDAFASDNPEEALLYNDSLYTYGFVRWPSIYSLKMWEYNVALALEAAEEMGFDEIQFDYVRLPEDVEDVNLRNKLNETRSQAITNFLRYAAEYLHKKGVYVSADVFGETSGSDASTFSAFVAYYGQFWPAISNAVDAISSMPYPDHFAAYSYGIAQPWIDAGELMYAWGRATYHAQENTYDPAKCRTWIMAQNSDPYEVTYGADKVLDQLDGLKRADVYDGFLTWNAASSLSKYEQYIDVLD